MGPTWVLSAPDGPHAGPMNLAIRDTCKRMSPFVPGRDQPVGLSHRPRLPYTEAVLHEAMRIFPVAPLALPRATSCDVEIRKCCFNVILKTNKFNRHNVWHVLVCHIQLTTLPDIVWGSVHRCGHIINLILDEVPWSVTDQIQSATCRLWT